MAKSKILTTLEGTGLPVAYGFFPQGMKPPYIVYIGGGQNVFAADNTHFWAENSYQVEYYFAKKNEAKETAIENKLLEAGYIFQKSEDVYLEEENVFLIYYTVN